MRHRRKVKKLGRPADQRDAMLRSLVTSLFTHDEITTTQTRAKAAKPLADKVVRLAKRGDLHAIRQVARIVYNSKTGNLIEDNGRQIPETVLRRIFRTVGPRFADKQSGFTRVIPAPPRRGDAAKMALMQVTE